MIVPPSLRLFLIKELHQAHPGIIRMKSLALGYMWWQGIDADMEDEVRKCRTCQSEQKSPLLAPVQWWQWPDHLWNHVHIDYTSPFIGKMFLLLIDTTTSGSISTCLPSHLQNRLYRS